MSGNDSGAAEGDTTINFVIGTLPDGRVILQFCETHRGNIVTVDGSIVSRPVDHLKLTRQLALDMAEGLVEAVRQAKAGRIILTGGVNDG